MCGISGEIRLDGDVADVAAVAAMTRAMEPRGPDGSGLWSQGPVALGHRRLDIIDLSETGAQPMVDTELGLHGSTAASTTTSSSARSCARRATGSSPPPTPRSCSRPTTGGAPVRRPLLGMFAFAIVERDCGLVVLGRDRLGIKPLYLTQDAERVRFASRARAAGRRRRRHLHRPGGAPPLHDLPRGGAAAAYDLPRRLKLPPAHRRHRAGRRAAGPDYWAPDFTRRAEQRRLVRSDWQEAVLAALRPAVERRMVADVPVGCCCPAAWTPASSSRCWPRPGSTG